MWTPLLAAAGLVFGLWWAQSNWRLSRQLLDTATARLRSAAQGYTEITGIADTVDSKPLLAPISGSSCVWWAYRSEQRDSSSHFEWHTVSNEVCDLPFILRDDDTTCLVDPRGAQIEVTHEVTRLEPGSNTRYYERRIAPGEKLCILGEFRSVGGTHVDLEQAIAERLRQWKADPKFLLQHFDVDGDGQINEQEWEAARAAARQQTLAQQATDPVINTMSRSADGTQPLIITTLAPEKYAKRLRWRALLALLLSGACLIKLLPYLLHR